jgi:large conductance mechanosensitive channel
VVTAFVKDIITPLIGAIFGAHDFSTLKFKIHHSTFLYGDFLNFALSFVMVAAAIYFFVVMPLNMLAERRAARLAKGDPDPDPKPEDILLLEQIRDLLQAQHSA